MRRRIDIHGLEGRLRWTEMALHDPVCERNGELLKRYERQLLSEGLSAARVAKYLYHLKHLREMPGKPFEDATVKDIRKLVYQIEHSDYSPWTKHDYKVALKRFYKWLKGRNEKYLPEVRWIKTTLKAKDEFLPEDLITEEEVMVFRNFRKNMLARKRRLRFHRSLGQFIT